MRLVKNNFCKIFCHLIVPEPDFNQNWLHYVSYYSPSLCMSSPVHPIFKLIIKLYIFKIVCTTFFNKKNYGGCFFNPLIKREIDFICYFLPTPRVFELFVCQVSLFDLAKLFCEILFCFFWISNEPFFSWSVTSTMFLLAKS